MYKISNKKNTLIYFYKNVQQREENLPIAAISTRTSMLQLNISDGVKQQIWNIQSGVGQAINIQ